MRSSIGIARVAGFVLVRVTSMPSPLFPHTVRAGVIL